MTSPIRTRHTHPVFVCTVILAFSVIIATQGLVTRKAVNTASDARETLLTVQDVTDPNCNQKRPVCRRTIEQRRAQATVVADVEEVAVIGSYCAHQHEALEDVRSCVRDRFAHLTGRQPSLITTSTTYSGG